MGFRASGDPRGLPMHPPLLPMSSAGGDHPRPKRVPTAPRSHMSIRVTEPPSSMRPPPLSSVGGGHHRTRHAPAALTNRSNASRDPGRRNTTNAKQRLAGKAFVLDIMDQKVSATIERDIQKFGGTVVYNIDEDDLPYMLVSDSAYAKHFEDRDGSAKIKEGVMKKVPMMIRDAFSLKVYIRHSTSFMKSLQSLKRKFSHSQSPARSPKIQRRLTGNIMRIDDKSRRFAPLIKEYKDDFALQIHLGAHFGQSLFHCASQDQQERRKADIEDEIRNDFRARGSDDDGEPAQFDRDTDDDFDVEEDEDEEDAPDVTQKAIKVKNSPGFCENCQKSFKDQHTHFSSAQHKKVVSSKGFYDEVDGLLGSFNPAISCPGKPLLRRPKSHPSREPSPDVEPDFEYFDE